MACFCSVPLGALLGSLPRIPSLAGLVPPMSMSLVATASTGLGFSPALNLSAVASASASASAVANLSAMASLSAAMQAALGMNLSAALSASAVASTQASLSAAINGFNANGGVLTSLIALLERLLRDLLGLVNLSGLLMSIRAAFNIDMRAPGAIAALQARLAAMASASATVRASAHLSAVASLMTALGFQANAQGALAVNAQARATASLLAGVPAFGFGLHPLALLASLLAMLEAILKGLGVNLLAPSAALDLRLALSGLPLQALAQLSAQASVQASATASAALAASVSANASASLNLAGTASANLSAATQLSMLLSVMAKGMLGLPAGSCGGPCPLALLQGLSPLPTLTVGF